MIIGSGTGPLGGIKTWLGRDHCSSAGEKDDYDGVLGVDESFRPFVMSLMDERPTDEITECWAVSNLEARGEGQKKPSAEIGRI